MTDSLKAEDRIADLPFAIVHDRLYEGEGLSLAVFDGEFYRFTDGDQFPREGDTLGGMPAQFLTDYQLEQKLSATEEAMRSYALAAVEQERAEREKLKRLYDELLFAVGNKYEGETRHQTALRYLRRAEQNTSGPAAAAIRNQGKGK